MLPFGKVRAQQEPDCGVAELLLSQATPGTVLATELNLLGKYLGKSRAGTKPELLCLRHISWMLQ